MESPTLGALLRRFRLAAGMSQEDLAEKSTVSVRTISDLERRQRMSAHLETVNLLANGMGLSTHDRALLIEAARPELIDEGVPQTPKQHALPASPPWVRSLPVQPTTLIGRETVLAEIQSTIELNPGRVITLTGPGGVGKTRLAIEAARTASPSFDDGVAFVSLVSVSDPALVAVTVAQALGIVVSSASLPERLGAFLADRHLLLVLDNFEHVVEAAPLIATLKAAALRLSVLVTSRVRLRLYGEVEYPVPGLDLPAADYSIEQLQSNEALGLFVDRVRSIDPDFAITEKNANVIAEICKRLDGIPLAIELAASRLRVLPATALLARLEQQLPLLAGGSRDMPQRQQSMRNTIAWSYNLLSPTNQKLLRWMSVFVGGFSLESAEAAGIEIGIEATEAFEIVSSLLDNTLLQRDRRSDATPRFSMLETIREYGLEQLQETGEFEAARMFHATHFLAFAEQDAPLPSEPVDEAWTQRLSIEHDNLVPAFDHLCRPETNRACLRFAAVLGSYWYMKGPVQEGWTRLRRAIELAPSEPTLLKTRALFWASPLAMAAGEFTEGAALAHEGIAVAQAVGDLTAQACAIHCLAWMVEQQEHWDAASELLEQELVLWTDLDNPFMQALALMLLGGVAYAQGDLPLARTREERAAFLFRDVKDPVWLATTTWYLGLLAVADGKLFDAALLYEESLRIWLTVNSRSNCFKPLIGLADVAAAYGRFESAAHLLGATDKLLEAAGIQLFPFDVPGYERANECSRTTLGEAAFESAYLAGRYLTPDDWLEEAAAIVEAAAEPTRSLS